MSAVHSLLAVALRNARQSKGFTLADVAEATAVIATDSAQRVSQAYLSQIESGRARNVSTAKLVALAAVYGIPVERLIEALPRTEADRVRRELIRLDARRPRPTPLRRLPSLVRQIDAEIEYQLLASANKVSVPLGEDMPWNRVRELIFLNAAAVDFDIIAPPATSDDFWGWVSLHGYHEAVNRWVDAVIYDGGTTYVGLLASIKSWWMDFDGACSITFNSPGGIGEFSFRDAPEQMVLGLRWRQLANLIAREHPNKSFAPPPPLAACLVDYVWEMAHENAVDVRTICATLTAFPAKWTKGGRPHKLVSGAKKLMEQAGI